MIYCPVTRTVSSLLLSRRAAGLSLRPEVVAIVAKVRPEKPQTRSAARPGRIVIKSGEIRRHAEIFQLGARDQDGFSCSGQPWSGVRLGIDNRDLRFDGPPLTRL